MITRKQMIISVITGVAITFLFGLFVGGVPSGCLGLAGSECWWEGGLPLRFFSLNNPNFISPLPFLSDLLIWVFLLIAIFYAQSKRKKS